MAVSPSSPSFSLNFYLSIEQFNSTLVHHCLIGCFIGVETILLFCPSIPHIINQSFGGYPPLFAACNHYNFESERVTLLIQNGADVNLPHSPSGTTPLLAATRNNMIDLLQLLLLNGANPNKKCLSQNYTPLHFLCSPFTSMNDSLLEEEKRIVDLLIAHGAELNEMGTHQSVTPTTFAVINATIELLEYLIALGGTIHFLNVRLLMFWSLETPFIIKCYKSYYHWLQI